MNARNAKKLRKEVRQYATLNALEYVKMVKEWSFFRRVKFCFEILFRK